MPNADGERPASPRHPVPPPPSSSSKPRRATTKSQTPQPDPPSHHASPATHSNPASSPSSSSPSGAARSLSFPSLLRKLVASAAQCPSASYASFLSSSGSAPLSTFAHLRSHPSAQSPLLSYQSDCITQSLTQLASSTEEKEDDDRLAQLLKQAKAAFTHLQACMTSAEAAPAFLRAIVQAGVAEASLRDELWCQLIKQTTGCHDSRAMALGLKVITLLLPAFQPSPPLYRILLSHVASFCPATLTAFVSAAKEDESLWQWRPVSDFAVLVFLLHNYHQQPTCNRCIQPSLADIKLIMGDKDLPDPSAAPSPPSPLQPPPTSSLSPKSVSSRSSANFSSFSSSSARSSTSASKNSSMVFASNPLFSSTGSARSSMVGPLLLTLPQLPSAPPPPPPQQQSMPAYVPSVRRAAATRGSLTWSAGQSHSQQSLLGVNVPGELIDYCDTAPLQQEPSRKGQQRRTANTPEKSEHGLAQQWDEIELQRRLSALMGTMDGSTSSAAAEPLPAPSPAPPAAPPLDKVVSAAPPLSSPVAIVSIGTQTEAAVEDSDDAVPSAPPLAPPLSTSASSDIPCAPPLFNGPPAAPPLDIPCAPPLLSPFTDVVLGSDAPAAPPPSGLSGVPAAPPPPSAGAASGGRNDIMAAIRAAKAKNSAAGGGSSSSGDSRSDLLAAIRAGPKLRKVGATDDQQSNDNAPPPPAAAATAAASDPRADLLAAIRAGGRLRKVGSTAVNCGSEDGDSLNAPPLAAPSASAATASSGDSRSDLLKAIQSGVKLRKVSAGSTSSASSASTASDVPPPPPAPPLAAAAPASASSGDSRFDMLKAIQGGVKLRKVVTTPAGDDGNAACPPPPPPPPSSSLSSSSLSASSSVDPRDELLQAIRGGIKLRKATTASTDASNCQARPSQSTRSVTVAPSPSHKLSTASAIPTPPSLSGASSTSISRSSSVDSTSRSSSSGSQSYDLQSALSTALFRRKSRMQYDTMRTLTSPLSSSLSSSPTHQPARRLTAINDAFEGDETETTIQLSAPPVPDAPPMAQSDDVPLPPPPPPPPGPPSACSPSPKPARFVPPKPAASSTSVDPRDELLAAIRGGARLQSVSARPLNPARPFGVAGRHERSGSSLSEVVGVASSMYHSRLGSVSVMSKPVAVELKRADGPTRPTGVGAGGRESGSISSNGANSELAALLKKRQQKIADAAAAAPPAH